MFVNNKLFLLSMHADLVTEEPNDWQDVTQQRGEEAGFPINWKQEESFEYSKPRPLNELIFLIVSVASNLVLCLGEGRSLLWLTGKDSGYIQKNLDEDEDRHEQNTEKIIEISSKAS